MRITARTAPAGDTFMTRFPEFDHKISDLTTDGKLDEGKVRAALSSWQDAGFVVWGRDSRASLAFAVEFLSHLASVTRSVEADATTDAHTAVSSASDKRLERKMKKGLYAFTRFDITQRADGICVRVSCANPFDVPGTALDSARRFAVYACRILNYIKREIEKNNKCARVNLVGVGDLADVFDEAEWTDRKMSARDAVESANAKRESCTRRVGEYCSPVDVACQCHNSGRCVLATLPTQFQSYKP